MRPFVALLRSPWYLCNQLSHSCVHLGPSATVCLSILLYHFSSHLSLTCIHLRTYVCDRLCLSCVHLGPLKPCVSFMCPPWYLCNYLSLSCVHHGAFSIICRSLASTYETLRPFCLSLLRPPLQPLISLLRPTRPLCNHLSLSCVHLGTSATIYLSLAST